MSSDSVVLGTLPTPWPTDWVPARDFAAYLDARRDAGGPSIGANEQDLYLACACVGGVSAAIEAFHSKYAEDIRSALERLNLSADDVADVTQTMFQELLLGREAGAPTLASYVGRGSLGAWIRVSATRKGLGVLRRSPICATGDDEILEAQVPEADLELAYMRSLYGEAFRKAFLTAMAALDSRDKNFLRQHFIDGLTIDDLARAHLVHRATAARWIQRARTRLLEETRREFARQSEVSPLECESVLRLLQSRLDVTWRRLLA